MSTRTVESKRRISIELPGIIIQKLDRLASQVNSNRSELIRTFLSEKLAEKERKQFSRAMKAGYEANYDFIKESNEEWDFTLGDGV
jgi:metal-responsive CopG/Arc/MetJ family transcriptional regulator